MKRLISVLFIAAAFFSFFMTVSSFIDAKLSASVGWFIATLVLGVVGIIIWAIASAFPSSGKTSSTSDLSALIPAPSKEADSQTGEAEAPVSTVAFAEDKPQYSFFDFPLTVDGYHLRYSYDNVIIVGTQYLDPPVDFDQLPKHAKIEFIFNPQNQYDSRAVEVHIDGKMCGHVRKGTLQDMIHDYYDRGWPVLAYYFGIGKKGYPQMSICFYTPTPPEDEDEEEEDESSEYFTISLIKTSKKDDGVSRQDNYDVTFVGDQVEFEYDSDSDSYIVTNDSGEIIGETNQKASEKIYRLDGDNEITGEIEKITTSESGRKGAVIKVCARPC